MLSLVAAGALPLWADHPPDKDKAGHSIAGESFSEGPRQRAELLPGVAGLCRFPVTTASAEAQQFFDQGVAQLHGFWFLEAERSFRQVLQLDPNCTMAYWGITMANVENPGRAKAFIADGMSKKRDHLSPKERGWLQSLSDFYEKKKGGDGDRERLRNLVRDWEQIVSDDPEDLEAKAFLVGRIWRSDAFGGVKISSHLSVDALAHEVLAKAPHHPGIHHYRIHFWNNEKDARALASAAALGPACPGIAHNWHMPGHTYSALHRYADAAWQQEASARVDHAHMIRYAVMPDEIHNYSHNNGWLVEDLGYIGRAHDAIALAQNLIELPRIPRGKAGGNTANQDWNRDGSSWAEGRRRLAWALLTYERWDDVLRLEATPYLELTGDFDEDLRLRHLCGLAHFEKGDALGGLRTLVALYEQEHDLQKQRDDAMADAEKKNREAKKSDAEIAKARENANGNFTGKLNQIRDRLAELTLVQKLTANDIDAAKKALGEAKGIPNERLSRYFGRVSDWTKALELAKRAADESPGQVAPAATYLALLRESIAAAGDKAEPAKVTELNDGFQKLRSLAAHADLDLELFRRLGELAQGDWRLPAEPAKDLGPRPPLDQLGPAHWSPPVAPAWAVTAANGDACDSKSFAGKPYLLVFFLGRTCTHCMEQLNALAPKAKDFEAIGLPILAVGTDTVDGLAQTMSKEGNPFPFRLFSDHQLIAFKAFRAFDDFENQPLHSTVFVDAAGRVRWQHTSFNPFMKPDFLLDEVKRLMKLPAQPAAVARK